MATEPAKPLDPATLFQSASPSVLVVEAETEAGISQGSGVVVARGEIVTNFHVIKGSRGLVTLKQGRRAWRAEVSAVDEKSDLARLTVLLRQGEAFDLPVTSLRTVQALTVGERVYAIGAPRGLEQTLTEGLISGLPSSDGQTFVQTSAAISSGSSGGGLFDARGKLVGITTMYLRESQNLNFAVPTNRVQALMAMPYAPPPPPNLRPALAAGSPELPLALGRVRAIYLVATSSGPIATQGDLTAAWLVSRVARSLRMAGVEVITDLEAPRESEVYAVIVIASLDSLDASASGIYPWRFDLALSDRTQFTDGAKAYVTIWNGGTYGYGGSKVVVDQVVEVVDSFANKLALAILAARAEN